MRRIHVVSLWLAFMLCGTCSAWATETGAVSGLKQETARSQVRDLQEKILSDGDLMELVAAMQNDPDIRDVLNDPSVLQAVLSMDINALNNNPRFRKLLDNPRMKEIQQIINQKDNK
jgi:hypothetical protein